ncbi:putative outer membrane protein assembly factor [Escherichia coli]|uniref:Translocation and assembly module subunit TamA n=1 Tax=Escherichia coli TaxID=562 RepID=A0A377CGY4_ECOLX|nr:putative outer membrane protein assembly factor [Escherichia coli]
MLRKLTLLKRICRRRERPSTGRGVIGTAGKNVRAQLSTIESDEVTPDRRFRARVDDAIREGLKALGYYQPTIEFDLRPPPKKGRQVLIAKVTPGVPVLIGGTDVVLRGGARTDKDYLKLLDTRPAIGTVLNQGDYENFKKSLTSIALRKGYFDSEFTKAQLASRSACIKPSGILIITVANATALGM